MELVGYEDDKTRSPSSFNSWVVHSDLNIGKPARLFYSPLEENHGNGILTSPVVDWKLHEENGEDMYILETQNSIFSMKLLE